MIGGASQELLYCLPGDNTGQLVFGIRNKNQSP